MAKKAAPELIDEHVSVTQSQRAVDALLKHVKKIQEEKEKTELLPGREQHVWLNLTVKQMQPEKKLKPFKIPIVHPLVDPRETSICLITKDPQREYKDLLEKHKIKFISRVVGVEKLKGKFKGFEEKRMLLKENGMFLADERVIPLLPGLLGKKFFQAKKQPIPVCLTRKDLKGELERAISSTYFHQNQGTCSSIKIGVLTHSPSQVVANLKSALPAVIKHIKGGWDNVQSLHIKTSSSASLPIWTCDLGSGDGGRWDGLVAEDVEMSGSEDGSDDEAGTDAVVAKESDASAEVKTAKKGKKRAADEEAPTPKKKAKSDAEAVLPASVAARSVAKEISTSKASKDKAQKKKLVEPQAEPEVVATPAQTPSKVESTPKVSKGKSKANKSVKHVAEPTVKEIPAETPSKVTSSPKEKTKKGKAVKPESAPAPEPIAADPTPLTPKELKQKRSAAGGEKKKEKAAKSKPSGQTAKETLLGKKGPKA